MLCAALMQSHSSSMGTHRKGVVSRQAATTFYSIYMQLLITRAFVPAFYGTVGRQPFRHLFAAASWPLGAAPAVRLQGG